MWSAFARLILVARVSLFSDRSIFGHQPARLGSVLLCLEWPSARCLIGASAKTRLLPDGGRLVAAPQQESTEE